MDPHKRTFGDSENSDLQSGGAEVLMPRRSRYAGQAIDVSSRRSIAIQPTGERNKLIDANDGHCVIDWFYHEGKFWRAVIPLDGVDEVYGQAFNFSQARTRKGDDGREVLFDKR